jgi:hypothetical protein
MLDRGLLPDFSQKALDELDGIREPIAQINGPTRDLRNLHWCSIDNDESRDLDQLTVAEAMPDGTVKVRVVNPPVEGRLVSGFKGLDVGHRLSVRLVGTDVERGYIDFEK